VRPDDVTVVAMYGAFDIDSLQFETRCLLRKLRTLTGESEDSAIRRALQERYQRLAESATLTARRRRLLDLLRPGSPAKSRAAPII
jgi:hypothetical protein